MDTFRFILAVVFFVVFSPLFVLMIAFELAVLDNNDDVNIKVDSDYNTKHTATIKLITKLFEIIAGVEI